MTQAASFDRTTTRAPNATGWSARETSVLIEEWMAGTCRKAIADRLRKSPNAVTVKAHRLGLPPQGKMAPKDLEPGMPKAGFRPCMCCGKSFLSEGIQHRLCDDCKEEVQGAIAPIIYV